MTAVFSSSCRQRAALCFLSFCLSGQFEGALRLYPPGALIGDGGTASVIKFEKRTGLGLGKNGGTHEKKGREMIKYIEDKILTQNLSKSDRKLANNLIKKLKQALGGK